MQATSLRPPLVSDLVLIGGGHAHVHVLKMLGMPKKGRSLVMQYGIRVTLIARDVHTPYSGMLPGFVAGHYTLDQIHLDLQKLCRFANVRLIHASAKKIVHADDNHIQGSRGGGGMIWCDDDRPPIRYDALSIDIGSSPSGSPPRHVVPVKPIARFSQQYAALQERFQESLRAAVATSASNKNITTHATRTTRTASYTSSNPLHVVVVGGGAGGIELALSIQYNLQQLATSAGFPKDIVRVTICTRGTQLAGTHNGGVQRIFRRILQERNIPVRYQAEAVDVKEVIVDGTKKKKKQLILSSSSSRQQQQQQSPIFFDECLWCTSAGASSWLGSATPFDTTDNGFIKVQDTYESVSHRGVFAAGDCCHNVDYPRPKAGVFAVRAGPPLFENLLRYLTDRRDELIHHKPQSKFLGLISTGDTYAIASRGDWFAMEGKVVWSWKDYIDVQWMAKYTTDLPDLEEMMANMPPSIPLVKYSSHSKRPKHSKDASSVPNHVRQKGMDAMEAFDAANPMRSGGYDAKVGATTVSRVLKAIHKRQVQRAIPLGLPAAPPPIDHDDAAVIPIPPGASALIHTIDYFRSFVDDPYLFGKIAAIHALSDVHAMGGSAIAQTALARAVIPFAVEEAITETTLMDVLAGASDVFQNERIRLVGGHTCEGMELACGFAIQGYSGIMSPSSSSSSLLLLRKRGGQIGDKIILTKPLGTGALFAADMRAKAVGHHVVEALQSMCISNGKASRLATSPLYRGMIHACTDVSGFGFAGHLLEMLMANDDHGSSSTETKKKKQTTTTTTTTMTTNGRQQQQQQQQQLPSIGAVLNIRTIPFLQGGLEASKQGIQSSSLYPSHNNTRTRRAVSNDSMAAASFPIQYPLLFDPQTAGGLLFFVDPTICNDFVEELRVNGDCPHASVVGELEAYFHHPHHGGDGGTCTIIGSGNTMSGERIRIEGLKNE